jgi:hypothetical protein
MLKVQKKRNVDLTQEGSGDLSLPNLPTHSAMVGLFPQHILI